MIILFYIIFFFLILRFTVTLFNFISNPKLTASVRSYHHKVSVLIPARNEAENILSLLESLKEQDYQNIEVIILDDHSEDNTYAVCKEFCETDGRFRIIKGKKLEKRWLGKNYACHQLAKQASGHYLIFIDADEIVQEGLINNTINRMEVNKLHLLSLFTNQIMLSTGEKLVVPMMHFILLNLLPLRLVRLFKNPALSAASGQFMMFEASTYREKEWHRQVKSQVVEDVEIMKRVKQQGFRGEALLANGYIFCRMYKSYQEALHGFSKNLLSGFGNSVAGLLIYLFLVIGGPILVLLFLNLELFVFCCSLIILSRLMISLLAGQNPLINIIIHPFQVLSLGLISVYSIYNTITKRVYWKGRKIEV